MRTLTDLDQYFDPGLTLTVLGKTYVVPLASAELGIWCRRMAIATGEVTSESSEDEVQAAVDRIAEVPDLPEDLSFPERVLGGVHAAMVAAGVPDAYIQYCAVTAYLWIIAGEELAERWWTSGGRPEALRPGNRAQRRAKGTGGHRTGGDGSTPSPASTSGTRSPRTSRRAGKGRRTGR